MDNKIRELTELIERKRLLISKARSADKDILNEELEDMQIALKLLEITNNSNG